MPLLNSVTTPYAEALLQVVNENSQTEEMVSEVKQLLELINDSPELEKALSSPILETDAKTVSYTHLTLPTNSRV